jgi:O-antigen ligase
MDLPAVKPAIEHGTDMLIGRTEADIVQGEQYSRSRVTRAAITQFMENPIFGSGMAEQETGDYPHNLWIEAFMATGVVGGVAMLVVTLKALKACMLVIKTQRQGAWVGLIFLQYLVAGLFSGAIWGSTAFWCFAVGTVSLAVLRAPKRAAGPLARERVLPDLG